ncbi:MAG TPA: carbohydrate-binding module family 20 domain-containing protein [Kiritimatiellia bacterium]|nr:carbohydrate-binding module family 20 domain-containing protein [Kiritimatiellia bacterium]
MVDKKQNSSRDTERVVTFEITTEKPLPVGQQVFISGNVDILGNWQADGFPLTRLDDNLWSGYAVIANNIPVEFKITRGTWTSEEASENNLPRVENLVLAKTGNVSFKHTVKTWIDRR